MFVEYLSRKRGSIKAWVGKLLMPVVTVMLLAGITFTGNVWADNVNLLVNGSFEQGSITPANGLFAELPQNSLVISGWKVEASLDYMTNLWQTADGNRSLDMNASPSRGKISQSFPTKVGKQYQVTFMLAGNPACGAAQKKIEVTVASSKQEFIFDTTGRTESNMGWIEKSFVFTASSTTTILTFSSLTDGNCGPALDNVHVYTVDTGSKCEHAVYSVTNNIGKLVIPFVEIPLLNLYTHQPTGELAVFSGELKQVGGLMDFSLVSSKLKLNFLTTAHDPCHALYDETQKTLHVPFVDVGNEVYDVKFQHLKDIPLELGVFHLESYDLVE